MNDEKIVALAEELKSSLYELKEFKEYFRLKKLYEESEEIKSLEIAIKQVDKNSKQYQLLLKEYDTHPLVVNFNQAKEEVYSILKVITDIINK